MIYNKNNKLALILLLGLNFDVAATVVEAFELASLLKSKRKPKNSAFDIHSEEARALRQKIRRNKDIVLSQEEIQLFKDIWYALTVRDRMLANEVFLAKRLGLL